MIYMVYCKIKMQTAEGLQRFCKHYRLKLAVPAVPPADRQNYKAVRTFRKKVSEKMEKLTLKEAKRINDTMMTEKYLQRHVMSVSACMGVMAEYFGEDKEHWEAVGYLHDYDYEKYPEEHLKHTEKELLAEGVSAEDVRAIMSHGYGICTDVEPVTNMEKCLFTVDGLSGIIRAVARMRPNGIYDMDIQSFMKKFKNKGFAAKCDRGHILRGCEMLGMDVKDVAEIVIKGMKAHAEELGLGGDR